MQKEIHYNNLNALRILEFTILDYLDIETVRQTALVTPDWYWIASAAATPSPATFPPVYADVRGDLQQLVSIFVQRVGARPTWTDLVRVYDPQRLAPQLGVVKGLFRDVLSLRLFACQNREGNCTKQESTVVR